MSTHPLQLESWFDAGRRAAGLVDTRDGLISGPLGALPNRRRRGRVFASGAAASAFSGGGAAAGGGGGGGATVTATGYASLVPGGGWGVYGLSRKRGPRVVLKAKSTTALVVKPKPQPKPQPKAQPRPKPIRFEKGSTASRVAFIKARKVFP